MTVVNVYEKCPVYETDSFRLRLVTIEDAQALLVCYSDPESVSRLNTDFCTSDFYYTSIEEMTACIKFWLKEYEEHRYVRFAVVPKISGSAVGTVEIFGGEAGILRIDLAADYEKEIYIEEILRLAVLHLIRDFRIGSLKIKTANTPERIPLLKKYGFVPSKTFRPELVYYERPVSRLFDEGKGVAFCGLACCVCSENAGCAGCRNEGCQDKSGCKSHDCCRTYGLEGCWECDDFPCEYGMFHSLRVKAFAKYIAQNGADNLIRRLKNNEEHGVIYHYEGQLTGDYDLFQSEEEIFRFINQGL